MKSGFTTKVVAVVWKGHQKREELPGAKCQSREGKGTQGFERKEPSKVHRTLERVRTDVPCFNFRERERAQFF